MPYCEPLAIVEVVAEGSGEHLDDGSYRFGDTFDEANRRCAGAETCHEEHRQQTVDDFGRDIHEQADTAKHPDAAWNLPKNTDLRFGLHYLLKRDEAITVGIR
jgi:hypothetical protein